MESQLIEVDFRGVRVVGPESFMCAVLVWEEQGRVMPVWLSPIDAAELSERSLGDESGRRRPTTHDVLVDALSRYNGGVSRLAITSSYEGVFIGEIQAGGEEFDARASDVLILSEILELPILVDEEVLAQTALKIADDELQEYLDISLSEDEDDEVSAEVDEELQQLMRDIGAVEEGSEDSEEDEDDNGNK